MQPQQPYQQPPVTPGGPPNDYDFILNPESRKKPGVFNRPKQLLLLSGLGGAVIIFGVVIFSLLTGGQSSSQPFVSVVAKQQELVRVAALGYENAGHPDLRNFVLNSQLSITTDKSDLQALLADGGIKISEKELLLSQDATTDKAFENALATSTLDATLLAELQEELEDYQAALKLAYPLAEKKESREVLQRLYDNAELLLKQSGRSS